VAPLLAFSIAKKINKTAQTVLRTTSTVLSPPVKTGFKRKVRSHNAKPLRTFVQMIPGKEIRGSRVEFDNRDYVRATKPDSENYIWRARLHLGEGKDKARAYVYNTNDIQLVIDRTTIAMDHECLKRLQVAISEINKFMTSQKFHPLLLQEVWASFDEEGVSPKKITSRISLLVNTHFPKELYFDRKIMIPVPGNRACEEALRIRLVVSLILGTIACEVLFKSQKNDSIKEHSAPPRKLSNKIKTDASTTN
jgi:hypothetical protein